MELDDLIAALWPLSESSEYAAELGLGLAAARGDEAASQADGYDYLCRLEATLPAVELRAALIAGATACPELVRDLEAELQAQSRDWAERQGPPAPPPLAGQALTLYRADELPGRGYGDLHGWTSEALAGAAVELQQPPAWHPASLDALRRVHEPGYLAGLEVAVPRQLGPETVVYPDSLERARLGAGALLAACGAAEQQLALVLCPPGSHHARRSRGGGTCLVNQLAVAAAAWPGPVGVLDLDAHHGDGTQDVFYEEARVKTASVHQAQPFFPGTGLAAEQGSGAGAGANLNLAVTPAGDWRQAALEAVAWLAGSSLVLVELSADAHWADPASDLAAQDDDYHAVGQALAALAVPVVCELGAGLSRRAWVGALRQFVRGYADARG